MSLTEAQFMGTHVIKALRAESVTLGGMVPYYYSVKPQGDTTGPRAPMIHIAPVDKKVSMSVGAVPTTAGINGAMLSTTGATIYLSPHVATLGFIHAEGESVICRVHIIAGVPMAGS